MQETLVMNKGPDVTVDDVVRYLRIQGTFDEALKEVVERKTASAAARGSV